MNIKIKTQDLRIQDLASQLEAIAHKRHGSRRKWSLAADIHPTQMSHFLNGKAGVSLERLLDLAAAAGAMVLVAESDVARPMKIGSIDETGRLMSDLTQVQLPGSATIVGAGFGPFKDGDEVTFAESEDYQDGRWLLIRVGDSLEVSKAQLLDNIQYLINARGEEIRYRSEKHKVIGVLTSRTERM